MPAGRMRDRVTFQRSIRTADGGGGASVRWVDVKTVWGELRMERGQERIEAGRLQGSAVGVLRVRSTTTTKEITPAHRAVISGEDYQIRSNIDPDRRNRWREMLVEVGVAS